jgi:DNA-binding NtrC family response regulator
LLEKLPSSAPGCILLDVKMSGLNGPQLQERLGELGHRLPIVFLTGYGDVPTSVRAIIALKGNTICPKAAMTSSRTGTLTNAVELV